MEHLVLAWARTCRHVIRIFFSCCHTSVRLHRRRLRFIWSIVIEWRRSFNLTNCDTQAVIVTTDTATIPTLILLLHSNLHHFPQFILFTRLHYDLFVHSLDHFLLQQSVLVQLLKVSSRVHFIIACLWYRNNQTPSKATTEKNCNDANVE